MRHQCKGVERIFRSLLTLPGAESVFNTAPIDLQPTPYHRSSRRNRNKIQYQKGGIGRKGAPDRRLFLATQQQQHQIFQHDDLMKTLIIDDRKENRDQRVVRLEGECGGARIRPCWPLPLLPGYSCHLPSDPSRGRHCGEKSARETLHRSSLCMSPLRTSS